MANYAVPSEEIPLLIFKEGDDLEFGEDKYPECCVHCQGSNFKWCGFLLGLLGDPRWLTKGSTITTTAPSDAKLTGYKVETEDLSDPNITFKTLYTCVDYVVPKHHRVYLRFEKSATTYHTVFQRNRKVEFTNTAVRPTYTDVISEKTVDDVKTVAGVYGNYAYNGGAGITCQTTAKSLMESSLGIVYPEMIEPFCTVCAKFNKMKSFCNQCTEYRNRIVNRKRAAVLMVKYVGLEELLELISNL